MRTVPASPVLPVYPRRSLLRLRLAAEEYSKQGNNHYPWMHMQRSPDPLPDRPTFPGIFFTGLMIILLVTIFTPAVAQSGFITAGISTDPPLLTLNATDYEKQALALQAAQDWAGVLSTTREGLSLFPDDAELMCLEAYALRKTGHYQESVDILDRAIPLDPRPARYANRAYGLLAMGRYQEALNDTCSAIALNSSYAAAWDARALAFLSLGNLSGADQAIDTALSLDPASAHTWQVKGEVLSLTGNCTGAIQAYQRSIAINPDYSLPWPGMTNATTDLGQEEQRCAAAAAQAVPATTKAGLPAMVAMVAVGVGVVWVRKKE